MNQRPIQPEIPSKYEHPWVIFCHVTHLFSLCVNKACEQPLSCSITKMQLVRSRKLNLVN